MKRNNCLYAVVILLLILACGTEEPRSPVVAKVGEAELSIEQIKNTIGTDSISATNELERYIYRWVDNELLYQAALAEGFGSQPEIQEELRKVRRALIINSYLDKKFGVLPEIPETRQIKHYTENKDEFIRTQTEYRYFFVICKERSFAQQILRDVRNNVAFEDIVKENYPERINNSVWDSGYVPLERVIPELQRIIQNLKPGNSYGPVASSSGNIILKLQERYDEGTVREFEQVQDLIKRRLEEEWYREQYQLLLGSLKNNKSVIVNLEGAGAPVSKDTNQVQN